jgi:hypothetical protein
MLPAVIRTPDALAQLAANGKALTVTTSNSLVTFAGADLVGFHNALTNEDYLKYPSTGELASVNTMTGTGQALQTSNWSIGTEAGTGAPLATVTVSDSVRTMTVNVKVDPVSQEIVLKSSATVTTPGLRDISWSMAALDMSAGRLIVPFYTGMVFDAAHPPINQFMQYPNTWHAQMAVYEAAQGSFILYSTDSQFLFKDLRSSTRSSLTTDLAVVTEAIAPFTTAASVPSVEWRLKAFAGDWKTAAQVYKSWLNANRPPVSNSAYSWVQGIRTVVGVRNVDQSILAPLAAELDPAKTLLYLNAWRLFPYDNNYPDYTPGAGVADFITAAHNLGFKVMLHFDLPGVSPGNAAYTTLQAFQVRAPDTLQLIGWDWNLPPSTPYRFAYIDPASSAYRSTFVSNAGAAINAVHPDALHLDISASMYNDGNGLIGGMSFAQGSAQLHKDLLAAFPNVALGGEGENDILYQYQSFAQAWTGWNILTNPGHPIADFLFSSPVQYYGHLAQPQATDPSFKQFLSDLEHRAVVPSIGVLSTADLDLTNADNARLIGLLQNFQNHSFQPDWASDWTGTVVRYTGADSTTATFTDSGTVETLTGAGLTLYQLSRNVNQLATASFINNWPAFDAGNVYGMDPGQRYWLDATPRPTTTHITSIPAGNFIGQGTMVRSKFAHVELSTANTAFDFFQNLFSAKMGIRYQGTDWPMAYGAGGSQTIATVGGVTRLAISLQPPWQGQYGGETFVEYSVPILPQGQFQFSTGIIDGASCTDGVTFRVTVNGTELYRQNYLTGAWHDGSVDLSAYANSTITMRIISNPGPQNNSACDWAAWSQLNIVYPPTALTVSVPLALDGSSVYSGVAGDGSFSLSSPNAGMISGMRVPGQFTVFTQDGAAVAAGTNLAAVAFDVSSGYHGEIAAPGGVAGAGSVGSATSGGLAKNPGIFAHPPNGGRAVLSWTLHLPAATPLRFGWSAGILDGASSNDGVDFSVLINGIPYWQWTKLDDSWTPGSIDLQQWRGQNVLIQLITDSRADNTFDWADWADLILSPSAITCVYSLPSQIVLDAAGGQFSVSVTATDTCPWAAVSSAPWLSIVSGGSGIGNGTVTYAVAQNTSTPRSGVLVVGGRVFVVIQKDSSGNLPLKRASGQVTSQ